MNLTKIQRKKLERMQHAAFRSLFKCRMDRGMSAIAAFSTSIVDTSDTVMEHALKVRPDLVKKGLTIKKSLRIL